MVRSIPSPDPLLSYSTLHRAEGEVRRVRTVQALREAVVSAGRAGRQVGLHAGGNAFHDQALGHDLTLVLDTPRRLTVEDETLVGDARAPWGEAVPRALAQGLLTPGVPTATTATLGGSLASDTISRFTPTAGKESAGVRWL